MGSYDKVGWRRLGGREADWTWLRSWITEAFCSPPRPTGRFATGPVPLLPTVPGWFTSVAGLVAVEGPLPRGLDSEPPGRGSSTWEKRGGEDSWRSSEVSGRGESVFGGACWVGSSCPGWGSGWCLSPSSLTTGVWSWTDAIAGEVGGGWASLKERGVPGGNESRASGWLYKR
jgi:hypothetical protein